MLLPRAVYERVGGFDERFFMYSEESDWQRRIHDAGWQVAFTPSAEVTHLGGASGASDKARINRYFFDSLDRYERKHHGLAGLVSLRAAMAIGCLVRAVAWSLLAAVPRRRNAARAKARLNSWLFIRQTTHWRAAQQRLASRSES
jgi:GT2 family glycosyltransferase